MVWIADFALSRGWKVSGSDLTESENTLRLSKAGANIHIGVDPGLVPDDVTEAIITSAITPIAPHFSEYQKLQELKVPIIKRAQWVGKLTKQMFTIAVAGAHGKTTTTGMIGWILDQAGLDPTVFVGSSLLGFEGTKIGQSEYLVLEADEYDRSFHQFYPQIAVILNIDKDHTDYYTGGLPEIEQSYKRFLKNLPSAVHATPRGKGRLVAYGKDSRIRKISKGFKYAFNWYDETKLWPGVKPPQPGKHNLLNATAAARVAHELGVDNSTIQKALNSFPGVGRRFEYLGRWNQAEVYDDYAHHPTEVASTLEAIRERWPVGGKDKFTLIFQPHQKARTKELLAEFGRCFDQHPPDTLILAPIYSVAGREGGIEVEISQMADLVKFKLPQIGARKMDLQVAKTDQEWKKLTLEAVGNPGIVMLMGAGNIHSNALNWWKESADAQAH